MRILIILLLAAGSAGTQTDVHAIAKRVDRRYNNMQTLQANFTETYHGAGISRVESGTLELKNPGKMRWDYREPRPKLFISDGKTAWFYVPGEQQVRRAPVKKLEDLRSPIRYLLGKTKLEKEFAALTVAPDVKPVQAGDVVLRGVPKGMEDRVTEVLLEVTPEAKLRRIVIEEVDGSTADFQFQDQKENVAISDARFHFTPPPGVETVEATEVAQ